MNEIAQYFSSLFKYKIDYFVDTKTKYSICVCLL